MTTTLTTDTKAEAELLAMFRLATEQQQNIAIGMLQYCTTPQDEQMHVIVGYSGPERRSADHD